MPKPAENVTKGHIINMTNNFNKTSKSTNTSLKELAKAYREDEIRLNKQIDTLRENAKKLTGAKKHTANRNLCCLYEMRRDVRNTAEILENYYSNRSQNRIYHKKIAQIF